MPILIIGLLGVFLAVVLVVIGLYRSSSKFAVEKRIEQIMAREPETAQEELERPFVQRVLLPLGDLAARLFRGHTPAETAERNQKKLVMAGLYPRVTPVQMQGLGLICAVGGLLLVILLLLRFGAGAGGSIQFGDPFNLVFLILGLLGGYEVPQFVLSRKVKQRQAEILIALPYALDLLTISVEAGMGFDAAVGYTMSKTRGPLAEEFSKTLNEIRLGKPRLEALEDLGNRTGVDDLKTFITAIVHASRLGGSITNTLRVQANSIRVRQRQRAQEQAMKAPVKMVIPLVLFIFPALFVVILGPAFMAIMHQL